MELTLHDTADSFFQAAGPFLETEEVLNSLILRVAAGLVAGTQPNKRPPVMMTVAGQGGIEVAMLMTTPPQCVLLYAPGGAAAGGLGLVIGALIERGDEVRGCMALTATAKAFADLWAARTGQAHVLKHALRLYEIRKVESPAAAFAAGRFRSATTDDLDLAAAWQHEFGLEAQGRDDAAEARAAAERTISGGKLYFWEDAGRPVCQAWAGRGTRHGAAIGAVYTPPDLRRRGYATALVSALSRQLLDSGREFCCLFTDLANPTSNSIYRKIGYVPVADASEYNFQEADKHEHL